MRAAQRLDNRTKAKRGTAYIQLWNVVDGAVADAFNRHDDYLTEKGAKSAPLSIVKRVTGTVLGFALQEARRQRELAEKRGATVESGAEVSGVAPPDAAGGVNLVTRFAPHCRVGKVRFKCKSRYRSPVAFNITTNHLREAIERAAQGRAGK